jgi:GT2 family glycosyltransferase
MKAGSKVRKKRMNQVEISAGIVTYNNAKEIIPCLNTLVEYTQGMNLKIYIFDNHSQDKTVSLVRAGFPQVHIIESSENYGFGYGHNQILKRVASRYHMVVNPDIQFVEHTAERLVRFLEHNPKVGMVTPQIRNLDGSEQFLPKRDPKFSYVILSKLKPFRFYRDEYTRSGEKFTKPTRILSSTGCFFIIRTELFRENNGFDERYFMYFEDADLSRSIRKRGAVVFYPKAYVYHAWKRDNTRSLRGIRIFLTSMMKYFWKWKRDVR